MLTFVDQQLHFDSLKFVAINAVVGPYKNKSLNLCDKKPLII